MPISIAVLRLLLPSILLPAFLAALPAGAVGYPDLAKYWTPDAQHVPYRAIETPGRRNGERLPLIVFLHGDWQDGTNNESQLAGYGNGSMELHRCGDRRQRAAGLCRAADDRRVLAAGTRGGCRARRARRAGRSIRGA